MCYYSVITERDDYMFSDKLKGLRKKKGLSMEELADNYNKKFDGKLNKSTLSRYENGLQEPMINVVKNLATFFNVSLDYLTEEHDISIDYLLGIESNETIAPQQVNKTNDLTEIEIKLLKYISLLTYEQQFELLGELKERTKKRAEQLGFEQEAKIG